MTSQKCYLLGRPYPCDLSAKVIVHKFLASIRIYKSLCLHWHKGRLLVAYGPQIVERFSWRHVAMAWTVHIKSCKSEACKNRIFQVFKYWVFFLVFFLTKWHRVLGNRQSDVREINWGSLPFSSWPFCISVFSTFFTCSTHSVEIHESTDVFKFCQYAFII